MEVKKGQMLVGNPASCFLPHGPDLNLSLEPIIHNMFFQFQNVLIWAIINYLVTLTFRDWVLGEQERMWGGELGNGRSLGDAQSDFFPKTL